MGKINVICLKCGTLFKVDEVHIGKKGRCTKCGERFIISRPQQNQEATPDSAKKQIEVTQPARPEIKADEQIIQPTQQKAESTQPILATVKQTEPSAIAETIPTPKVKQAGNDIAATIAAPAQKDGAEIQQEEQDVPIEWEEGQTILDLYEVKKVHTGGGMGLVYRVHHKNWNMDLAVKSPRADYFKTEAQKENFIKECETWINLGLHPNIVSCYYVRTLGGIPRVFAEYAEGGSLKDWIENKKLYDGGKEKTLERILDIAIQFAWGLHYAHEYKDENVKGLVHQDVKPANVMMTEDGTAKVTDFGLAKARSAAGEVTSGDAQKSILVSSGGMTPAYCSPEQANKQPFSRKTDIWSWGLSVLEMFAGEVFWRAGQAAPEALENYLEMGTEDESIQKMPNGLVELLKQCFQRNPDNRPKDMQEIVNTLKEIYKQSIGNEYPRERPAAAKLLADGLNNRAISLFDLGRQEEADELFEEALRLDSNHLQITFNKGYSRWREGRIRGDALVVQMQELEQSHGSEDEYWRCLAWIHFERGNLEAVQNLLQSHRVKDNHLMKALEDEDKPSGKLEHTIDCKDSIESVDYSPDGLYVVLGMNCGTLFLLDVTTHNRQRVFDGYFQLFEGHDLCVPSVRFSSDGRYILSGGYDHTVRLWEAPTSQGWRRFGKQLRLFRGHHDSVTSVAFSPDSRFVFSGSRDSTIRMWESATGREVRRFEGHQWAVTSVCVSADGHYLLSGGEDNSVRLWCTVDGKQQRVFVGHTHPVKAVTFSPKGSYIASGSSDRTIRLWETGDSEVLHVLHGHTSEVNSVCFSPDSIYVLSGSGQDIDWDKNVPDNTLRLWEVSSGRELREFDNQGKVSAVCFSPDGRHAVSGSPDKNLRFWEMCYARRNWGASHPYPLICRAREITHLISEMRQLDAYLTMARDHIDQRRSREAYHVLRQAQALPGFEQEKRVLKLLIESGTEGKGRRRGIRKAWNCRSLKAHDDLVKSVSFSPDGRFALSAGYDKTIRIWEIERWEEVKRFQGHSESVQDATFSANAQLVASGSADGTIRIWEIASGAELTRFEGHNGCINAVRFSPDGLYVLSGSVDGTVRLWDAQSRREVRRLVAGSSGITSLCFSPEGHHVAVGSTSSIRLIDVANGEELNLFKVNRGVSTSVCFSPDGRSILSASSENVFHMWKADTGEEQRRFSGHKHGVASAMYSADGYYAVSGSFDKTVCLWDIRSAQLIVQFEEHRGPVYSVCFSPDGRYVISGSADRTIGVWEIDWEWDF